MVEHVPTSKIEQNPSKKIEQSMFSQSDRWLKSHGQKVKTNN